MTNGKIISERIAIARKEKNMSQTDLAKLLNMSAQNVSKWERGESLPDVITLSVLAKALGKDVAYFYDETVGGADASPAATADTDGKQRAVLNESRGKWKNMDFAGAVMDRYDFKFARFENCNFAAADLKKSKMPYTEFLRCELSAGNFAACEFFRADFKNCELAGTDFSDAVIKNSDFTDCVIKNAVFDGAAQEATSYDSCRIENVRFAKQDFRSATFTKTVFTNCTFTDCSFMACKFKNAEFRNCRADKISYNFLLTVKAPVQGIEII